MRSASDTPSPSPPDPFTGKSALNMKSPVNFIRTSHGTGAKTALVRIENPLKDLPEGVAGEPAPLPERAGTANGDVAGPQDRSAGGRFGAGNSIAKRGGHARAGKVKLAARLGLSTLPDDAALRPYLRSATSFRKAYLADLARSVGGGYVGPGPASLVATAALQLAWSRYLGDQAALTGDGDLAAKASALANASRQSLLGAHALAASEARTRPRAMVDHLAQFAIPDDDEDL
jgi:hypothetical protein